MRGGAARHPALPGCARRRPARAGTALRDPAARRRRRAGERPVSRRGTNPSERTAIGLDVGGTKIAGAVVGCDGEVLDRLVVPTPTAADGAVTIAALLRVVDELRA